jgi:site-specific DNA-adenine methylase
MENKKKISKSKNKKFIYRMGSKDQDIKHFKQLLPMDISKVVEPFGGSFALCRCIYYEDKYKKYVNDNSRDIVEIFNNLEETNRLYQKWRELAHNAINYGEQGRINKLKNDWYNVEGNETIKQYIQMNQIARGKHIKSIPNVDDGLDFIKKVYFTPYDFKDCIKKHMHDKDAFIFLDPPYMFSNNTSYSQQCDKNDCTGYLLDFLEILENAKCKIMLIINDLKLIRYLFRDYNMVDYNKTYGMSRRQEKHLVIMNY